MPLFPRQGVTPDRNPAPCPIHIPATSRHTPRLHLRPKTSRIYVLEFIFLPAFHSIPSLHSIPLLPPPPASDISASSPAQPYPSGSSTHPRPRQKPPGGLFQSTLCPGAPRQQKSSTSTTTAPASSGAPSPSWKPPSSGYSPASTNCRPARIHVQHFTGHPPAKTGLHQPAHTVTTRDRNSIVFIQKYFKTGICTSIGQPSPHRHHPRPLLPRHRPIRPRSVHHGYQFQQHRQQRQRTHAHHHRRPPLATSSTPNSKTPATTSRPPPTLIARQDKRPIQPVRRRPTGPDHPSISPATPTPPS